MEKERLTRSSKWTTNLTPTHSSGQTSLVDSSLTPNTTKRPMDYHWALSSSLFSRFWSESKRPSKMESWKRSLSMGTWSLSMFPWLEWVMIKEQISEQWNRSQNSPKRHLLKGFRFKTMSSANWTNLEIFKSVLLPDLRLFIWTNQKPNLLDKVFKLRMAIWILRTNF